MIKKLLLNYKMKNILLLIFLIIITFSYAINSYLIYNSKKIDFYNYIDKNLEKNALSIKLLIDDTFFDRAIKKDNITNDEDEKNIKRLSEYAKNVEIDYLYTMVLKDGEIYFTSSSAKEEDYKTNSVTQYFDKYQSATDVLKNVLKEKNIVYEEASDKWGKFRSIFIPMQTKQGNQYILGADIKIDFINQELDKYIENSIKIFLYISICLIVLFFVYRLFSKKELKIIEETHKLLEDEIKKKTEELTKLNNSLEQRVQEELEKNILQEKILIQKARSSAMGEMMETIIHQWRQPLSIINAVNSELVFYNRLNKLEKDKIDEVAHIISNQVKYMSTTMSDFRDFFKPTQKKECYLNVCIQNTLSLIGKIFESNGIKINFEYEEVAFNGYPNELIQVFMNILNNSKDAIEDKNPTIKEIDINLYKENNKALITITDYAGGIDENIINKIFEPYFSTKDDKGTGIGLDMSKMIINKVNGDIKVENVSKEVENNIYKGAKFIIILPLK